MIVLTTADVTAIADAAIHARIQDAVQIEDQQVQGDLWDQRDQEDPWEQLGQEDLWDPLGREDAPESRDQ